MRLLLDTHAFLWWLTASRRLSAKAREVIADENNEMLVSAVVAWECATKHRLGKLPEAERFVHRADEVLRLADMSSIGITQSHALRAGNYVVDHGDPFDRMLAAQAEIENLILVTSDKIFRQFPIRTLW